VEPAGETRTGRGDRSDLRDRLEKLSRRFADIARIDFSAQAPRSTT